MFLMIFCSTFTLLIVVNWSLVYFNFSSWKAINTTSLYVLLTCIRELDHSALQATLYLPVNETSLRNYRSLSWWPQVGIAGSLMLLWPSAHILCSVIARQPCMNCVLVCWGRGVYPSSISLQKLWSLASIKNQENPLWISFFWDL